MKINDVHLWEQGVIEALNLDDWNLTWSGGAYEHYDAEGKTPKGSHCVIEMKFRQTYYDTKMLEKFKYDALMNLSSDITKLYFVNDPKGNYLFWLNKLKMPPIVSKYCPDTTLWTKKRTNKDVYMLDESQATIINYNNT
tara:strand:- start:457 stop:873 length:417 start_codon:yes stop_codon:yes gene_type:complete